LFFLICICSSYSRSRRLFVEARTSAFDRIAVSITLFPPPPLPPLPLPPPSSRRHTRRSTQFDIILFALPLFFSHSVTSTFCWSPRVDG
jgi:hypothetical protein